ncbi:sigma-70 family RNA polymerase sigma factor [Nocardia seriolae]|uniref:Nitrogenase iron-molybdenum cofactor biosynthesis protein NifE n=2 Tax=Nocardia seriolae TaxID=37332 RepID=A0ABC9YUK4_9NOCA|nr:sigma-70 family RNA polymerase sigma factor [Nocardia seriolae]WKY52113.1 sigma-70 family RNA polymerase sigma factor [Nocardia seriolae]WNJ59845.1 sigma-70 family RNA polymerase sigma factor [Nocardia seriolae]GAM47121.1 nitrogenase iron-molybdenum cofactor biosynthesis protein NifE [Nocardia seriolae]GAP29027.1 nitrogenase iron-molybdenum cofactor biosynthesis protein NifE [Nocardia seriolae]
MNLTDDEFEAVRRDPDPLRRGRRATELITFYQQRATELARLRRASISEAYHNLGMNYTEIAAELGITKGRITQIRTSAPPPERAFFGVGPVAVGIPRRYGFEEGRERSFFDAADTAAQAAMEATLGRLSLVSTKFAIEPDCEVVPEGDAVVICGPKSAPVARTLLAGDPYLDFLQAEDRWWITDSRDGRRFDSPYRRPDSTIQSDVGYFGRHVIGNRIVLHVAGIMSVGSLGVCQWIESNIAKLYDGNETHSISGVVHCDFDDNFAIVDTRLIAGPYLW